MCNAHNHPPDCNCGWGGVWYGNMPFGGGSGWLPGMGPKPRRQGEQKGTFSYLSSGFVNPNAECPVCGDPVYYYESPYGGKVYFDELGPPWPKHPCTTHEYAPTGGPRKGNHKSWESDGWRTLSHVSIDKTNQPGVYLVTGSEGYYRRFQFHFYADEPVVAEIFRFKQRASGEYYVSVLDYDVNNKRWQTWHGLAYVLPNKAKTQIGKLAKTFVPADREFKQPETQSVARSRSSTTPPRKNEQSKVESTGSAPTEMCSFCHISIKSKNYRRHLRKVHGWKIITTNGIATGMMFVGIQIT